MGVLQDIPLVDSALGDYLGAATRPFDNPRPENDFRVGVSSRPLTTDESFSLVLEPEEPAALAAILTAARELGLTELEGVLYQQSSTGFSLTSESVDVLYATLRSALLGEPRVSGAELQASLLEWLDGQGLRDVSIMFTQSHGFSAILSPSPEEDFENPVGEEEYEQQFQQILTALVEQARSWPGDGPVEIVCHHRQVTLSAEGIDHLFHWVVSL